MTTPLSASKPSISVSSWFSVCSRSSLPPKRPVPGLADSVDLVDEDDARGLLLGLLEQVPDPGRAHAHEHLHEFGAGNGEEGDLGLPGHCLGQQSLSRPGRPHEQGALGNRGADFLVFLRLVKKIHDLRQRFLGLILAGDVGEGLAGLGLHVDLRLAVPEGHGVAHAAQFARHAASQELAHADEKKQRQDPVEQRNEGRILFRDDLAELDFRVV
jgi:hypothetical protein